MIKQAVESLTPIDAVRGLATVVIPNYNHAPYLADAIESVLAQDFSSVELIIVDDGSTDHSQAVIERFGNQVKGIFQENQGLSAARNSGIRAARGEFIGVLDADDRYEPHFLSTLVRLLEQQPDAAAVYCGYQFVDEENRPLPQIEARQIPPSGLFNALAQGNFLVPEAMLVRRSGYEAVGLFDPTLRACEDLDVWLRLARRFTVIGTPAVLTRHRILAGSMSTDPARMHQNRLRVLEKHMVTGDGSTEPLAPFFLSSAFLTSMVEYLQTGQPEIAYRQLREGVALDPAILHSLTVYYELLLGPQPKGWRGDFASANIESNFQNATTFIESLGRDPDLNLAETITPAEMMATLHMAAGMIAYGQAKEKPALRHFGNAVRHQPEIMLQRSLWSRVLKIITGARRLKAAIS